jgi:hypothetical protein
LSYFAEKTVIELSLEDDSEDYEGHSDDDLEDYSKDDSENYLEDDLEKEEQRLKETL